MPLGPGGAAGAGFVEVDGGEGAALGGSGKRVANLLPTTHKDNHSPAWRGFERAALAAHEGGETIRWAAEVDGYYAATKAGSGGFPTGLEAAYMVWDAANHRWRTGADVSLQFLLPQFAARKTAGLKFHAAEMTRPQWEQLLGKRKTGTVISFLLAHRERWKRRRADLIASLQDEEFEADMMQVEERLGQALGGGSRSPLWLTQGPQQ